MLKLTAVNQILEDSGNGGFIVEELQTGGRSEAAKAERVLDRCELQIQSKGWHYNQRCRVELTPDANGRLAVPTGVIAIDSDDWDSWRDVTQLGNALYDLWENTDQFSGTLRVGYTLRFDFECIPEPIAAYIQAEASLMYVANMPMRDLVRLRTLTATRDRLMASAKAFNARVADANILNTPQALAVRGGRSHGGASVGTTPDQFVERTV